MARDEQLPTWLTDLFPRRPSASEWASLATCQLRVVDKAAGLELEASDLGMTVDVVEAEPGQDPALKPGMVIVAVDDQPLIGLGAEGASETFGAAFRDQAKLTLLSGDELRRALVDRDSNEECPCDLDEEPGPEEPPERLANYELLNRAHSSTEYPATVRIPVGRGTVWNLSEETLESLRRDLDQLGADEHVKAEPKLNRDGNIESIVLSGLSSQIAQARPILVQIIQFYREGQWQGADPRADTSVRPHLGGGPDGSVGDSALEVPHNLKDLDQFMYHDHTADIIVHSWGKTLEEAFEQVVVGMFNYMTDVKNIDVHVVVNIEAQGHDLLDLLYHLLDEFLFVFAAEMHISRYVEIVEFDQKAFKIKAKGYGEKMNLKKHEQGTEIKAITMHMMKILSPDRVWSEVGEQPRTTDENEESARRAKEGFANEAFVLLDI